MANKNTKSSSMAKENTNPPISLPMDTKPATSLSMVKEEVKPVPCVWCLQLPGTKTDFTHWFKEMQKFECPKCGEMHYLFEPPSDDDYWTSYVGSDEEDHGSDPEKTRMI